MKIISAHQPYFAPYGGFFQKALQCHVMVLMDSVQFPRGTTWLTRNRFKNDQGTLWLTVPVWKKGLGLQRIMDVKICHEGHWAKKHLLSLKTAYAHAPYFKDHESFLEQLFSHKIARLLDFNEKIIRYVMEVLKIRAQLIRLSSLQIDETEPALSICVAKKLGATHFLAQNSAKKYLDHKGFEDAGIKLIFFTPRPAVYPQLWGPFIPNLSCLDILFNCGPRAADILARGIKNPIQ